MLQKEGCRNESQMKSRDIPNILRLAIVGNHSDWQVTDTEGDTVGTASAAWQTRQNSAKLSSKNIFISQGHLALWFLLHCLVKFVTSGSLWDIIRYWYCSLVSRPYGLKVINTALGVEEKVLKWVTFPHFLYSSKTVPHTQILHVFI